MKHVFPSNLSAAINQALGCPAPQAYKCRRTGVIFFFLRVHP